MRGPTGTQCSGPAAADGATCKEVGAARSPRAASTEEGVAHALHTAYMAHERATMSRGQPRSASEGQRMCGPTALGSRVICAHLTILLRWRSWSGAQAGVFSSSLGLALAITPQESSGRFQTGEKVSVRALRRRPVHHICGRDLSRVAPEFGIRVVLFFL